MEGFAVVLAVIVGLSLTTTKTVDLLRNILDKGDTWPKYVWNIAAFAVGIALCVGWQHSFVNDLFHQVPALSQVNLDGTMGYLLSGIIVGGASGFFHELLDALSGVATTLQSRRV
jgi:hypothetical protein